MRAVPGLLIVDYGISSSVLTCERIKVVKFIMIKRCKRF